MKTAHLRWIPVAAVAALAAFLFLWDYAKTGYANTYYTMAAQAGAQSWSALFFGSLDAGNFITVDKPPFALWPMALSVKLLGLSSLSILLPEALMGVASVVLLFDVVRRSFGYFAGLVAALVLALTPVAVLMFRYNNPDAALTLLFIAAAWCLVRALETGRTRWLVAAAVAVGFAFDTKFLQGFMVVPALALTYLVAGPKPMRTRIVQLAITAVALVVSSGWWMAIVDAIPAAARPFIGGSGTNSVLALVLGYDGLGRVFGQGGGAPGGGGGPAFSGTPGWLRLFNTEMAGEASWLIPFAAVALLAGLLVTARRGRTDAVRAGFVLWGTWAVTHWAVFSFSSGIIHSYYEVALAPAVAALVAGGIATLVPLRSRTPLAALALTAGTLVTAWWGSFLLGRTPAFAPGLGTAELAVAIAGAALLFVPRGRASVARVPALAAALCLAAMLFAPTAYSLATVTVPDAGGDPHAGPNEQLSFVGTPFETDGNAGFGPGGAPRDGGPAFGGPPPAGLGGVAGLGGAAGRVPAGTGGPVANTARVSGALVAYLVENYSGETWAVAVSGANEAAPIQIATGLPVMAMGGFNGGDDAPTLAQLEQLVRDGKVRFVIVSGGFAGPGGPGRTSTGVTQWVTSNGTAVNVGGVTLYDLGALAVADR